MKVQKRLLVLILAILTLTINCKNSPSSVGGETPVGGEMNCNKIKKNTCSGLGNVL